MAVSSWQLAVVRAGCLGLVRDRVATLRKLIFHENLRAAIKYCCEKNRFLSPARKFKETGLFSESAGCNQVFL
ncbi:hypothetical protein QUB60_19140 [Microcoleus sp. A2-C5]|uniref:hypothetical protein n=1 Tax=Microcoleus sp. A2-C2 TaxID=2818530 RepID=UPI002FCFB7F0